MFYLTTHSTYFIYGYMVKDHSDSERENPLPPHGLLFPMVLLYAPSHRQDCTYHSLCFTSRGALDGMGNSSMGPPHEVDPTTLRTMSERSYHGATYRSSDIRCYTTVDRNESMISFNKLFSFICDNLCQTLI